jgi:hypothetical protein
MPTATEKLDWMKDRLNEGKTVYISTYTKTIRVTPATYSRSISAEYPLFKIKKQSLYIARGKHYDCIDHTKIEAQ